MKYVLIVLIVLLAACEPRVNVSIQDGYRTINESSLFNKVSIVTGFEHQYDSINTLIVDKKDTTGLQYTYTKDVPIFNNIALSVGEYGFTISGGRNELISDHRYVIAYDQSVMISKGVNNIVLPNDDNQSCILIKTTGVTGIPSVQVGSTPGLMSQYGVWYYAYVKGPSVIRFTYNGQELTMPFDFTVKTFMVYDPASGSITIDDGWGALYVNLNYEK